MLFVAGLFSMSMKCFESWTSHLLYVFVWNYVTLARYSVDVSFDFYIWCFTRLIIHLLPLSLNCVSVNFVFIHLLRFFIIIYSFIQSFILSYHCFHLPILTSLNQNIYLHILLYELNLLPLSLTLPHYVTCTSLLLM